MNENPARAQDDALKSEALGQQTSQDGPIQAVRLGQRFDPAMEGTIFGVIAAVSYSAANVALRQVAVSDDLDWAVWVSCIKAVPAAVTAWILVGWRAHQGLAALPPRRLVVPLIVSGLFMQFGGNVVFQWALGSGGLALVVPVCHATLILSTAVMGRVFLAEPVTMRSAWSMLVLIGSIAMLSADAGTATEAVTQGAVGPLLIAATVAAACLSGIAYAQSGVVIRGIVTREVSLSATLVLLSSSGVVGLGVVSLVRLGPASLTATPPADLACMFLAGLFNAVAFFSLTRSLQLISVLRVSILSASQMAMVAIAGVLWFGEAVTFAIGLGIVFTIAGLLLMEKRKAPNAQTSDPRDR